MATSPIPPDSSKPGDPDKANQCPSCRRSFTVPDVREIDKDFQKLDYHCPHCGYHYARWRKDQYFNVR